MSDETVRDWFNDEFKREFVQNLGNSENDGKQDLNGMQLTQSKDRGQIKINTPALWSKLREKLEGMDVPARTPTAPLPATAMNEIYREIDPESNPIVTDKELGVRSVLGTVA